MDLEVGYVCMQTETARARDNPPDIRNYTDEFFYNRKLDFAHCKPKESLMNNNNLQIVVLQVPHRFGGAFSSIFPM